MTGIEFLNEPDFEKWMHLNICNVNPFNERIVILETMHLTEIFVLL